ncbi:MAG TPA: ABC transporter permease [Anaerolineales bacterium]|nr:ABC transporter permease [Anaerolineales bacterium]
MLRRFERLKSWEGVLLVVLIGIVIFNSSMTPHYLQIQNQVNLFQLNIEKIIIVLIMAFIIINAEIDLSVASVMALAGCVMAYLFEKGLPFGLCLFAGLLTGVLTGAFNGFMVSYVRLTSLVVTLSGLIGYRGLAHVLLENRSVGNFPEWFDRLGQQPLVGPFPLALIIFFVLLIIALIILQWSGAGRYVFVIGNNSEVARYSGVNVRRVKMTLFVVSGLVSAFAGLLLAARLGSMRGDTAIGTELEVITMVLLGGVSIFGGTGSLYGVLLSILIILNLRNGMGLLNVPGENQTGVIGALLILSVLGPNIGRGVREAWNRRHVQRIRVGEEEKGG